MPQTCVVCDFYMFFLHLALKSILWLDLHNWICRQRKWAHNHSNRIKMVNIRSVMQNSVESENNLIQNALNQYRIYSQMCQYFFDIFHVNKAKTEIYHPFFWKYSSSCLKIQENHSIWSLLSFVHFYVNLLVNFVSFWLNVLCNLQAIKRISQDELCACVALDCIKKTWITKTYNPRGE